MLRSLVVLFIVIIVVSGKAKDANTDCDPLKSVPVLNRISGQLDFSKSIDQLRGKTCEWIIDGSNNTQGLNIHLDFIENLVLGVNDSLVITPDNDNKTILYSTSGFQWPGVVLLGNKNKRIRVNLTLTNDTIDRKFDVKYGTNESTVQIQNIESTGKFVFPLNKVVDLPDIDFFIVLKTKINSKKLLLNLESLDLNGGSVIFDKVDKYSNKTFDGKTDPKMPDFLLTTGQQINIKLTKFQKMKNDSLGLQLHYELVDSICSQYLNVTYLDTWSKTTDMVLPNTTSLQSLSSFRCLNIFEHPIQTTKLLLDLRNFNITNSGDLITVLDGNSHDSKTLAVIESQFLDSYWRDLYLFSSANKMWIMYDSPQVINRESDTSPRPGVIGFSQGGEHWLTVNVTNTTIETKSKPDLVPIVFTFTTDADKQIVIDFDDNKPLPGPDGQLLIEIFESNGKNDEAFIKLNSGEFPPDIMASNTNQMRVRFNQSLDLPSINVSSVARGCHSTYLGTSGSSFSRSGQWSGVCSWLIPKKDNGTFLMQFSHLNLLYDTDEVIIEMLGTKRSSVLNFKGPFSTKTFPDLILGADQSYIMYIKRQNKTEISQMIGVSLIFIDDKEMIHEETIGKDISHEFKTQNYPNYYSVGSDHLWRIGFDSNQTKALLTIKDIDLSPGHQLLYSIDKKIYSVNSTDLSSESDVFVTNPLFLNLSSHSIDKTKQPFSGRGFVANLTTFTCGEAVTVEKGTKLTVATPKNLTGISKCIWTVSTKNTDSAISLLEFTVNEGKTEDLLKDSLRVWDSNSIRDNKFLNFSYFNTTRKSSSTNSLIIEYTIDPKQRTAFSFSFTQTVCENQCLYKKRCILPEFFCNEIDDCGDYSDERCNGTNWVPPDPKPKPVDPPVIYRSGVNGWVVFLVICPLSIGIGVLGTLFGPGLLNRYGRGRYREFQDFSEVS